MSVNLRSILISDPVDESCGALLSEHGIPVTTKYKLPKDELINELQVGALVSRESVPNSEYFPRWKINESKSIDRSLLCEITNSI